MTEKVLIVYDADGETGCEDVLEGSKAEISMMIMLLECHCGCTNLKIFPYNEEKTS